MRKNYVIGLVLASVLAPGLAFASPLDQPANDNFANAIEITSLPFTHETSNLLATTELSEPAPCGQTRTVWYRFTPQTDLSLMIGTNGSARETTIAVYDGTTLSTLRALTCSNTNIRATSSAAQYVRLRANYPVFIQRGTFVGADFGLPSPDPRALAGTMRTTFSVQPPPMWLARAFVPLQNDDVASAIPVTDGSHDLVSLYPATMEAGESSDCIFKGMGLPDADPGNKYGTAWYRHEPTEDGVVLASIHRIAGTADTSSVAIFEQIGDELVLLKCGAPSDSSLIDRSDLNIFLEAGHKYFFQVATRRSTGQDGLDFNIGRVEQDDVSVDDIRVEELEPGWQDESGSTYYPTTRRVRFDVSVAKLSPPSVYNQWHTASWTLEACPTGDPLSTDCAFAGRGPVGFSYSGNGQRTITTYWLPGTCLGDVELRVTLTPHGIWDIDVTNNVFSKTVSVPPIESDSTIGSCYEYPL